MADILETRNKSELDAWRKQVESAGNRVSTSTKTEDDPNALPGQTSKRTVVTWSVTSGPLKGQTISFYDTGNTSVSRDPGTSADDRSGARTESSVAITADIPPDSVTKKADHGSEIKRYQGKDPYGSGKTGTIIEYEDTFKQFSEDTKASDPFAGYTLQPGPKGTKIYTSPDPNKPPIDTTIPNEIKSSSSSTITAPDGSIWRATDDGKGNITKEKIFDAKPEPNKVTLVSTEKGTLAVRTDKDSNIIDSKIVPGSEKEEKPIMLKDEDGVERPHRAVKDETGKIVSYEPIDVKSTGPKLDLTNEPDPSFQVGRVVEDLRSYQKWLAGETTAGRMTKAQADKLFEQRAKLADSWTNEQKALRDDALTERSQTISRQNSLATTVGAANNNAIDFALKINPYLKPGSTKGFDAMMGLMFIQLSTLQAVGALDMPDEIVGPEGRAVIKRSFGAATGKDDSKGGKGTKVERTTPEGAPSSDTSTPGEVKPGAGKTSDQKPDEHAWVTRLTPEQQEQYATWLAAGGDGTYKNFSEHLNKQGYTISAPPVDPETPAAAQAAALTAAQPKNADPEALNVLRHANQIWKDSVHEFANGLREGGYDLTDGQAAAAYYMTPQGRGRAQGFIEQAAAAMGLNFNAETQPTMVDAIADAWTHVQQKIDEGDTRQPAQIALEYTKEDDRIKKLMPTANKEYEAAEKAAAEPPTDTATPTASADPNAPAADGSTTPKGWSFESSLPASIQNMGLEGTPGFAEAQVDTSVPGLPSSLQNTEMGLGQEAEGPTAPAPSAMMIGDVTSSLSDAMKRYGLPWDEDLAHQTVSKYLDGGLDLSNYGSSMTSEPASSYEEEPTDEEIYA